MNPSPRKDAEVSFTSFFDAALQRDSTSTEESISPYMELHRLRLRFRVVGNSLGRCKGELFVDENDREELQAQIAENQVGKLDALLAFNILSQNSFTATPMRKDHFFALCREVDLAIMSAVHNALSVTEFSTRLRDIAAKYLVKRKEKE